MNRYLVGGTMLFAIKQLMYKNSKNLNGDLMKKSIICILLFFVSVFALESSQNKLKVPLPLRQMLNSYTRSFRSTCEQCDASLNLKSFYLSLAWDKREKFFLDVLCPLYEHEKNFLINSIVTALAQQLTIKKEENFTALICSENFTIEDLFSQEEMSFWRCGNRSSKPKLCYKEVYLEKKQSLLDEDQKNKKLKDEACFAEENLQDGEMEKQERAEDQECLSDQEEDFCTIPCANRRKKANRSPLTVLINDALRTFRRAVENDSISTNFFKKVYCNDSKSRPVDSELFFVKLLIPFYTEACYDLHKYFLFLNDKLKKDENFLSDIFTGKTKFEFTEFTKIPDVKDEKISFGFKERRKKKVIKYYAFKAAQETDSQTKRKKLSNNDDLSDIVSDNKDDDSFKTKKSCAIGREDSLPLIITGRIAELFDGASFQESYKGVDKEAKFREYLELLKKKNLPTLQALIDEKKEKHKRVIFTVFEGVRLGVSLYTEDQGLQDNFFNSFLTVLNDQSSQFLAGVIFRSYQRVRNAEEPWNNCYKVFPESITSWTAVLKETEQLYLENIMS